MLPLTARDGYERRLVMSADAINPAAPASLIEVAGSLQIHPVSFCRFEGRQVQVL